MEPNDAQRNAADGAITDMARVIVSEELADTLEGRVNAAIAGIVTETVGTDKWFGDVDPPTVHAWGEAQRAVARQLMENGLWASSTFRIATEDDLKCPGLMADAITPGPEPYAALWTTVIDDFGDHSCLLLIDAEGNTAWSGEMQ